MLNKVYQGDCLDLMKDIPDNFVDLICTDPPYCVGASSSGVKSSFADFSLIQPFWENVFSEWQRILRDGTQIYINTDWRTYPFLCPILQKYFTMRNLIVWDYEWIKTGNWYRHTYELIIFCTHGKLKQRTFSASEKDLWRIKTINYTSPNKKHPSEKPIELCEKIIKNSSKNGDTVLDCFVGSGTTCVAAINTDRNFIGFELDEKYFEIAQKRIEKAFLDKSQPKIFEDIGVDEK